MAKKIQPQTVHMKMWFSLTTDEYATLRRVAQKEDRTLVAIVRRALAAYYAQHHPRLTA